jgi:LPPG:FO 2-phospho-L-lactate transferase
LREGSSLTAVTAEIARRFGVGARILPMTDEPVRTRIRTPDGWLSFQEYFVREKALVEVLDVEYAGAATARAAPGVVDAITAAELVIVCPSNPVTSIAPMLAIDDIAQALRATRAPTVAVSPIVGGAAVSGPAGELMRSRGLPVSALALATAYRPWLGALVVDESDRELTADLLDVGIVPVVAPTLMTDRAREIALARCILERVWPERPAS